MQRTEVLVDGLDHPEGVAWDPASGALWAGGEAGQLYRVDLESRTWSEEARMPGFVLGLAVDGRGRLAVCCGEALCVHDGGVTTLRDGFTKPNYAAFASDGTLYFSDGPATTGVSTGSPRTAPSTSCPTASRAFRTDARSRRTERSSGWSRATARPSVDSTSRPARSRR
jgi:sugar lactone lactonase YvrE